LAAAFWAVLVAMDSYPPEPFLYRQGQYLPQDVHARVAFRVPSPKLIEAAVRRARTDAPAVFVLNASAMEDITGALRKLPRQAADANSLAALSEQTRKAFALTTPAQLAAWRVYHDDPNAAKAFRQQVEELAGRLARAPVVDLKDQRIWGRPDRAILRGPGPPVEKDVSDLLDIRDRGVADEAARLAAPFPQAIRPNVTAWLTDALRSRPVYRYSEADSQEQMDAAEAAVRAHLPDDVYVSYKVGQRIARASRQTGPGGQEELSGLSADELQLLRAEHRACCAAEEAHPLRLWLRHAGRAGMYALAVVLLALYVVQNRPPLRRGPMENVSAAVVLLAALGAAKALVEAGRLNPRVAALPVLMAAVVFVIATDRRFALGLTAATCLLCALLLRQGLDLFAVLLAGGAAAVFQLDDVRSRTKLIRVAGVAAGVTFLGVWIVSLAGDVPWPFALRDSLWAAVPAALVGFIALGLLPAIERVFHTATSLTLLEWCDASKPLLRRLALEAPGTYNHCLQLGAMCETAAEAIGARGLLARAGAYYHDIGKINKPEYFIENQAGGASKHEKLSPAMSLLIVIGHVKDGLEMAREYGLPQVLHEFIATHHGTTLVQYFYHAAAQQRKTDVDRAPDEVEFRYPGPKPRHKEPAILMLADAAESSVRAMSEPTPGRIENQVHAMVTRRLMDGQLGDSDLTLREVNTIEESLIKTLCGMYHSRIAYPTPAGQKPSAAEMHPKEGDNGKAAQAPAEQPDGGNGAARPPGQPTAPDQPQ